VCISQYLLILTTLIAIAITGHLCNWNRVLQSRREFEIGLIMLLSFLCLAMFPYKTYKHSVDEPLLARNYLAARFDDLVVLTLALAGAFLSLHKVPPPNPGVCASNTPLQI
jgi:hypothetical protein